MDKNQELEIIKHVLDGEREAFALLIDEYQLPVYNLAYRMTGNSADADDLAQETFVRAYKHLWRYDPQKKFFTWLFTIALNLIKTHIKKNKLNLKSISELKQIGKIDNLASPEDRLTQPHDIDFNLLQLPYQSRALLVMKYQQDLSFAEISIVTGKSVSAVKMSVYRALERLKELMIA